MLHFSEKSTNIQDKEEHDDEVDLPLLKLSTVASATNNFSINNKIGQGGFGPVYKVVHISAIIYKSN